MASTTASMLAALASAGIIGWGDQYLVLLIAGLLVRMGFIHPVSAAAFIGRSWFLLACATAWAITTLPSLIPHNGLLAGGINALSGPISALSGGIFALVSAGVIAGVQPQLATSLYLLSRDARWTHLGAYHGSDVALLVGGATVASTVTAAKFVAKPGIALKTGTFGHLAGPMFATVEAAGAVVLTPIVLALEHAQPLLVLALALTACALMGWLLVLSLRWLRAAGRGLGRLLTMLDEQPREGFAVVGEFLLPGSGWLAMGYPARGIAMLILWGSLALLALTVAGSIIAIPAYVLIARASARALFRHLTSSNDGGAPPPPPGNATNPISEPVTTDGRRAV